MVFREVGPDYSFPDHSRPITGKQGNPALQSNEKLVTRTGAPQSVADIDINDHELTNGDFETGKIDIGGTSGIAMSIESDQSNGFEVIIDLYDDNDNIVGVIDQTDYAELQDSDLTVVVPVFSDRIEIRVSDTSNAANNTINGSINANIGTPTRLNAEVTGGQIAIEGASGSVFGDQDLDTAVPTGETAMVTYLSRALNSVGIEEFVTRVTDTTGAQVDPLNQDALQTVANDELRARLHDSTGTQIDPLNQDALQTVANDELRARLHDSTGTQVDPDRAADFPDTVAQQDLIGTGDLTIGPVSAARTEAVLIAANSEEGNIWDASVTWQDANGNVIQTEAPGDIGLNDVTEDYARLIRKGPEVVVTFTDQSGATANNINAFVDAHE